MDELLFLLINEGSSLGTDRLIRFLTKLINKVFDFIYQYKSFLKTLTKLYIFIFGILNIDFPLNLLKDLLEILGL